MVRQRSPYTKGSKIVKSITKTTKYGQKVEVLSKKSIYDKDLEFNMKYVNSSNINKIGYKKKDKILRIEFKNGIYDYFDVQFFIYTRLLNAQSKGKYFHQYIKNKYTYRKVN